MDETIPENSWFKKKKKKRLAKSGPEEFSWPGTAPAPAAAEVSLGLGLLFLFSFFYPSANFHEICENLRIFEML